VLAARLSTAESVGVSDAGYDGRRPLLPAEATTIAPCSPA
jgi:hypothetical protein